MTAQPPMNDFQIVLTLLTTYMQEIKEKLEEIIVKLSTQEQTMEGVVMMTDFFIDIKKQKGKWYWLLKRRNGKILCHSETYNTRRACYKTACLVGNGWKVENCKIREYVK